MINKRCDLCGLYACHHRRFEIANDKENAMTENVIEPQRILIVPPPPPVVDRTLQVIDVKKDWVTCNICSAQVCVKFLEQHLKVHIEIFQPKPSTAIVKAGAIPVVTTISNAVSKPEEKKPVLSAIERYKFRELEQACCTSSTSKDGRYSDFTIIFWEKGRPGIVNTSYSGGNTAYTTKEWERFSVHIVYDRIEDYFTISSKLLKRSGYSTYDNEETCPDRICLQDEIFKEVKRSMLFFRISPRVAYRHFRKLFKQEFVTEYDKSGHAVFTQSKNCETLQARLKTSNSGPGYCYGGVD